MDDDRELLELAAAGDPSGPDAAGAKDVADALVEPDWGGVRVVAALSVDRAVVVREGVPVEIPEELAAAMADAFGAGDALIEGHLTTLALRSSEGPVPAKPKIERPPILIPRAMRRDAKDDPFVRARDFEARARGLEPGVVDAVERGERHAFVATDLLWLDGTPLDDVPLLERKRLLDGVLEPSLLVRVTTFVKPSAIVTLVAWGELGFMELHYRAANSRYHAGRDNPDHAVAAPPSGLSGPGRTTAPPR